MYGLGREVMWWWHGDYVEEDWMLEKVGICEGYCSPVVEVML